MRKVKARRCMRQRIWQAMRIMRRFTVPDLCRVIEGATIANVQSYVSRLFKDEYLRKLGQVRRGHAGEYQGYQLVKDVGRTMPVLSKGRHKKKEEQTETANPETKQEHTPAGELPPPNPLLVKKEGELKEVYHDAA